MKRKIFAALLAVMMVVSMLPLSVMAVAETYRMNSVHFNVYKNGDVSTAVASYSTKIPTGKSVEEVCGEKLDQLIADNTGIYGANVYGWYFGDGDWNQYKAGKSVAEYNLAETEKTYNGWLNINVMVWDLAPVVFYDSFGVDIRKQIGDTQYAEINKTLGDARIVIPTPTKEGYTFSHWCGDDPIYNKYDTPDAVKAIKVNGWTNLHAEWTPNIIDLRYIGGVNGNYGYTEDGDWWKIEKVTNDTTSQLDAYTFAREGYTFAGWMDKNGDDVTVPYTVSDTDGNGVERVWAKWTINQYTITFDTDGGSEIASIKQNYNTEITAPENPTKTGYTFAGWEPELPATMPVNGLTVKAKWKPVTFTIILRNLDADKNVIGDPVKVEATYDAPTTLPENEFERTGYTFTHWDSKPEGNGKFQFNDAETISAEDVNSLYTEYAAEYNGKAWLNAQWEATEYTITFTGKDGAEIAAQTVTYDDTFTLDEEVVAILKAAAEIDGYDVTWRVDADKDGKAEYTFKPDELAGKEYGPYTIADNVTANYRAVNHKYTIEFADGVADEEIAVPAAITAGYGRYVKLAETEGYFVPEREGYTFTGWATEDGTVYAGDAKLINLATEDGETVTLTATWEAVRYKLTLELNGGELTEAGLKRVNTNKKGVHSFGVFYDKEYGRVSWVRDNMVTKEGYDFAGWYADEALTDPVDAYTIYKTAGDSTLYAKWEAARTRIYLELNGGTLVDAVVNQAADGRYYFGAYIDKAYSYCSWVNADQITKTGYSFDGWYKDADLTEKVDPMEIYGKTGSSTIYAKWNVNEYTITYVVDGVATVETYDFGAEIEVPADPTKTGYTFAGWDKKIPATMPAEDLVITATWTVNGYTITFANTGDTVIAPITQDYGTAVTAPADPTKTGYTFAGWDKEIPATMPAEDMTITAKWTANKYIVKFDANGGAVAEESMVVTYDAKYGEFPEVTRAKADFYGWYTADGVKVTPETIVKIAGNHTLTARWDVPSENRTQRQAGIPKNMRSIEIDTTEGGKTNVASGNAAAVLGSTYKLTVTPDEGFEIDEVLVNGKEAKVNKNGKVSFVVKADTRVEVSFVEIED